MRNSTRAKGFSLLELMAVMAILAVLGTIALFSYKVYLRKARNGEAVAFLMDIKMKQETYFMAYSQYVSTATTPDGFYPDSFPVAPSPWITNSRPWNCSAPANIAITGFCALGISPTSDDTFFQYVTMGWDPVVNKTVPAAGAKGAYIRDPARRWWFARARGFAGTGATLPFEFRTSSEVSEIIEIPPD